MSVRELADIVLTFIQGEMLDNHEAPWTILLADGARMSRFTHERIGDTLHVLDECGNRFAIEVRAAE